ncbi:MAG: ribosomal protein S18-alanine N-acetyltransferase [Eubacteriales bacterium]|nr:ribosomal protein S18-alanine N-acetyltransferase [Eubacteriales bacterium]
MECNDLIELVPLKEEFCQDVYDIARESLPEHWSLQGIKDVLKYENNIFFVAKHISTSQVIGFAGIMVIADEAELLNIAVRQSYRRVGVAQQLMTTVMERAKACGAIRMLLEVRMSNLGAMSLYRKNGFTDLSIRKNYYSNPREDALIMECRWDYQIS